MQKKFNNKQSDQIYLESSCFIDTPDGNQVNFRVGQNQASRQGFGNRILAQLRPHNFISGRYKKTSRRRFPLRPAIQYNQNSGIKFAGDRFSSHSVRGPVPIVALQKLAVEA